MAFFLLIRNFPTLETMRGTYDNDDTFVRNKVKFQTHKVFYLVRN